MRLGRDSTAEIEEFVCDRNTQLLVACEGDRIRIDVNGRRLPDSKKIKLFLFGIVEFDWVKFLSINIGKRSLDGTRVPPGDYLMVAVDLRGAGSILAFSDRKNFRKAFWAEEPLGVSFSTSLKALYSPEQAISYSGVASYLSNGSCLDGRTLFDGISSMGSAEYWKWDGKIRALERGKHWSPSFYDGAHTPDREDAKLKLKDAIYNSIDTAVKQGNDAPKVSMSGGYDARFIFSVLARDYDIEGLRGFVYGPYDLQHPRSDSAIAKRVGNLLNCPVDVYASHVGDFKRTLRSNIDTVDTLSSFCDEVDVLDDLATTFTDRLFCGDEWFGRLDVPLNTESELLDSVSIVGIKPIESLRLVVKDQDTYESLIAAHTETLADILASVDRYDRAHDRKDNLYLTQRITNVMSLWRQSFTSRAGMVKNPLLHDKVIDSVQLFGLDDRVEKRLFIEVARETFPDIFEIPIADDRVSLTGLDLEKLLLENRSWLIDECLSVDSHLEKIITRGNILKMLYDLSDDDFRARRISRASKLINFFRRKSNTCDRLVLPFMGPRLVKEPSWAQVVLRVVMLWLYLDKKTFLASIE